MVSLLINNASLFHFDNNNQINDTQVSEIINVNVLGTMKLTRNLLSAFPSDTNKIINILSVYGLSGHKYQSFYSASKHALKVFFESLAQEYINKKDILIFIQEELEPNFRNQ